MPWALIVQLILAIIKFILERRAGERPMLFEELHDAVECAHGGDCSKLEHMHERLKNAPR